AEGDQLKPEYEKKIRDRYYPSGYWKDTEDWFDKRLNSKELEVPGDKTRYIDEKTKQPALKSEATIDHHPIMVAEHWNDRGGNNMNQKGRAIYFNDTNNHRIVDKRVNSSDGAKARVAGLLYKPKVGPDFRGPDDKEG
ncbi:MAG: hypothetical protein M3362_16765, partial [Acidobacteriota bacterium]|nr:hypothetical protein [Acidobacteriota bacterium]